MSRKIILDCDPGHDDALAILAAYGNPAIDLLAVTTVCGNQTVDLVTRNALVIGTVAGMHGVKFARGAEHPLRRTHKAASDIHGESGMDGPALREPEIELDPRTAAELIVATVMTAQVGEITLVATAPLTNLALALRLEPAIAERVAEVAIMGGAIGQGNMTPSAEFNILVDPEAAQEVFQAAWPVTMMGLDVSHQALATPDVRRRIVELGNDIGTFADELLEFFEARYLEHQNFPAAPVHDLCPVVYLIDPTVFELVRAPIVVETKGEFTDGRTVVDLRLPAAPDCRHQVGTGLDHQRFWDIVVDSIAAIG